MRGNPGHCYGNVLTETPHFTPGVQCQTAGAPRPRPPLPLRPRPALTAPPPGRFWKRWALSPPAILQNAHGAPSAPSGASDRGVTPRFCSVKPKGIAGPRSHHVPAEGPSRAGPALAFLQAQHSPWRLPHKVAQEPRPGQPQNPLPTEHPAQGRAHLPRRARAAAGRDRSSRPGLRSAAPSRPGRALMRALRAPGGHGALGPASCSLTGN